MGAQAPGTLPDDSGGRMTAPLSTSPLATAPAQTFTAGLWAAAEPIFEAILAHPFLRGLTDGSLPEERFRFYVKQDALYLRQYARCLALASAKAPSAYWC